MDEFNNKQQEKICMNCQNTWREGDKYCRYCGAPMNQPGYKVREFYIIYGPMPVRRKHKCEKCGFTWENTLMIDKERYCPHCGYSVSIKEMRESESHRFIDSTFERNDPEW